MPIALIGPEPIRRQPGPYRDILQAAGFTLVYPEGDGTLTPDQLRTLLPDADVVMAGGERYSSDLLALAPKVKILARTGVGYDAIDVPAATAKGIAVTIAPGTNQESVAEQAFALLLAVRRKIAYYDALIRAGQWERDVVAPVRGLTLGIVGMGRIGRAMVPRALAFGMNVIAFDPVPDPDFDLKHGLQRRHFHELLAESDVVSLHLPATPETNGLFNKETFARMRWGSVLLNTARGSLVVERDLLDALNSGQLSGAGLDVFEREPPDPANPILHHPNVVSTPHLAGIDSKSMEDMATLAARCMVEVYQGRWPVECMVNREVAKAEIRP
jgi:phosphoglycerate dehydrogenase-like enzyme